MLKKLITNSLRPLGMFLLFVFAAWCIFFAFFTRDIKDKAAWYYSLVDFTVSFENRFYDYRLRQQLNPNYLSKDIVFVRIDDDSLDKIGIWPIPRTKQGQMIDKLRTFGAKVVALDILYPEESPPINEVNPDEVFAEALRNFQAEEGRRVFLAYTKEDDKDRGLPEAPVEMLNDALVTKSKGELQQSYINKFMFPIDRLVQSEVGLGFIDSREDSDGIFRQYLLLINVDTIYYGSLGLNAVEAYLGKKFEIEVDDNGGLITFKDNVMEISYEGETKIRYMADEENFRTVSLYSLLSAPDDDRKMHETFRDKLVFVGSTAKGAHDLRPSPLGPQMPGVFNHLNLAQMILDNHFFRPADESMFYSMGFLILGALLIYLVQKLRSAILDAALVGLLIALYSYVDKLYFMPRGFELKLFYCFFCFITFYSWNTLINFYEANKEKKQIKGTFARYVAPTIVDEMLKNPEMLKVGGQKMDITCLFSDVRDFTSISEGLTATELAHSLNVYMGAMTDIVFDTKGTLDKYIGDAIVAIWGAPLPIGNHAQYAVEGALKMMETLPGINEEFRRLGRPEFNVGIGLNTGECSVGNMGSSRIFSYTALGDNMNLGARLEGLCKYYGAQILISEFTLARLDLTNIKTRPIDKVIVKGKTAAVSIFEVLHVGHALVKTPALHEAFLDGHRKFMARDFAGARERFEEVLAALPADKPSKRFAEVCRKYLASPAEVPEKFDVTTMTEK